MPDLATRTTRSAAPLEARGVSSEYRIDGIIGFAFGNRLDPRGNRTAAPVNKKLSRLVIDYYRALRQVSCDLHVWVQWEIGACVSASTIPAKQITHLKPTLNIEKGCVSYLGTREVMKRVCAKLERMGKKEGATPLIVAHPDHLRRCMKVVRDDGKHQAMAVRHDEPDSSDWYDPQSGQLWTRTRHLNLLHDMIGQLNLHREAKNREAIAAGIWKGRGGCTTPTRPTCS